MGEFFKKHGATILSILAGLGVVATGVSAYQDGKNARDKEDSSGDTLQEPKRTVSIQTISLGAGTIGAIAASRYLGYRTETELLAALGVLSAYVGKRREGEDYRLVSSELEDAGTGDIIFIEDFTGRRFRASREHVDWALARYEEEFCIKNHATLNELYSFLELPKTCAGEVFGWSVNQNCPKEYQSDDFIEYDYALTKLGICYRYYEGLGYVIFYPNLPILDIAGTGGPHE